MKIIEYKKVEDCLEGTNVRDILLNSDVTKELIDYLGNYGKALFYSELPKPMYKIIFKGKFTLKGVCGYSIIRVMLPMGESDSSLIELEKLINDFKESE